MGTSDGLPTVCIAGKNNIAVESLRYLLDVYKGDIFVIPNQGDHGKDGWQLSLRKFAIQNNIELIDLDDIYDIEEVFFFSLEFDRLIKPYLFKSDKLFNIHFSLLPKYKGMYTSVWPVLNGDSESGVTLHKIDSGIDTGDIIFQKVFPINCGDTCRDVYYKCLEYGLNLFKDSFYSIINGDYNYYRQSVYGSSYFSKNSIDFNNVNFDACSAFQLCCRINAFSFQEYQLPIFNGVKVIKAQPTFDRSKGKFGEIVDESHDSFTVCTIDYDVIIYKKFS